MKIYLISGIDFDPSEWRKHSVAQVFKTREEAEAKLQGYMRDARSIINSCFDGERTQYTEDLHSRNGHPIWYRVNLLCDMADERQREIYIDTISAGFISETQVKWSDAIGTHTKELRLIDISIKEIEL